MQRIFTSAMMFFECRYVVFQRFRVFNVDVFVFQRLCALNVAVLWFRDFVFST
jgi:hypothetical protein